MALQALAEYAILSYAGDVNLTVSLASTNLDYQETFELHRGNQKLLQMAAVCVPRTRVGGQGSESGPSSLPVCLSVCVCRWAEGNCSAFSPQIPSLPTGLFVSAKGEGCCLMQVRLWGKGSAPRVCWRAQYPARLGGVAVCVRTTLRQPVSPLRCHPCWRRKWPPTPVFLPGGSHGQRSLAGYSPWASKRVGHDVATKPYHHCPSEPKVDGSASPWVKLHLILILVVSDPEQSPLLHPPLWDLPGGSRLFSQPGLNADAQPGLSLALPEAP